MASTPGRSSRSFSEDLCRTPSKPHEAAASDSADMPRTPGMESMKTIHDLGPEVAEPVSPTRRIIRQHSTSRKQARAESSEEGEEEELTGHDSPSVRERRKKPKYELQDRSVDYDSLSGGDDGETEEVVDDENTVQQFLLHTVHELKCAVSELQKENSAFKKRLEMLEAKDAAE